MMRYLVLTSSVPEYTARFPPPFYPEITVNISLVRS